MSDVLVKYVDPLRSHAEAFISEHADEPLTARQVADAALKRYRKTCLDPLDENLLKYAMDGSIVGLGRRLLRQKVRLPGFDERVPVRLLIDGRYKPLIGRSGRFLLTPDEIEADANRKLRLASIDRRSANVLLRLAGWMRDSGQKPVGPTA